MQKLPKGGILVKKERKSIQEMEKELSLDKVKPITVTPSVVEDFVDDGDYWEDLYKETLEEIYE